MFLWHGWHTILPISLTKGLFFVCFLLQQKHFLESFIVNILKKNDKNRNTQKEPSEFFFCLILQAERAKNFLT
jgi:hypothetical protein